MRFLSYGLGIDGGGTFTDIVVMDFCTNKIVALRKAPTTPENPAEGLREALSSIGEGLLHQVSMVSLATTFATNAIVENRGANAGLILVGYNQLPPGIPHSHVLMVKGGHNVVGEEQEPLDVDALESRLPKFIIDLDAVAVAGFFSVRNPAHEVAVGECIAKYRLPVVCGYSLSARLDSIKRATTAWWNARLVPLINKLIDSVLWVLTEMGVDAPLMIVKGDGSLMSVETARERAVETLFSGPAASLLGARHLSGLKDGLIVDMGGTTTDMGVLKDGGVALDPKGVRIGGWETHVEAARIRTIGVGGDSLIWVNEHQKVSVGPRKVTPLCIMAERYPAVMDLLRKIRGCVNGNPHRVVPCSCCVTPNGDVIGGVLAGREYKEEFISWDVDKYERQGLCTRSSLTPTDLCVAAGRFRYGLREASLLGISIFASFLGMGEQQFVDAVEEEISRKLCLEALLTVDDSREEFIEDLARYWLERLPRKKDGVGLDVQIKLTAPVIGAGSPAREFLGRAFAKLRTSCVLPEAFEVSVAVGAVVGMVENSFTGRIHLNDNGRFVLYTDLGKQEFPSIEEAVQVGKVALESLARKRMKQDLVAEPLLSFNLDKKIVRSKSVDELFLEAILVVRATGRPGKELLGTPVRLAFDYNR